MTFPQDFYSDSEMDFMDTDDYDFFEEDAHCALSNHDVIEQILSFIPSAKDLKSCRLVSKAWSEVATTFVGKKTFFSLHKLSKLDVDAEYGMDIQPGLLRNIEICIMDLVVDNLPFLAKHRGDIEDTRFNLQFNSSCGLFLPGMSTVFGKVHYPRLKKLVLLENSIPIPLDFEADDTDMVNVAEMLDDTDDMVNGAEILDDTDMVNLAEMLLNKDPNMIMNLNLKFIKTLHICVAYDGLGFPQTRNNATFQLLIDHCHNLEELEIRRNFYPDLSGATKLKSLVWYGPDTNLDGSGNIVFHTTDFSLSSLVTMLEGAGAWLENLSLGFPTEIETEQRYVRGIVDGVLETERVKDLKDVMFELYPRMPKLTNLFVSDVNIFAISPESLTRDQLPALENLTLRSTQKNEFPLKILCSQNLRVESKYLSINQVPTGVSDIWKDVAATFPNLKKLSVRLNNLSYNNDTSAGFMKNTLNLMAYLLPGLEDLNIQLKYSCTLEQLMDAIWAKGFKGKALKRLKIVAAQPKNWNGIEGCDNFRKPFMLYKNFTLIGFLIEQDTRQKMINFISKRKLNINLFS